MTLEESTCALEESTYPLEESTYPLEEGIYHLDVNQLERREAIGGVRRGGYGHDKRCHTPLRQRSRIDTPRLACRGEDHP